MDFLRNYSGLTEYKSRLTQQQTTPSTQPGQLGGFQALNLSAKSPVLQQEREQEERVRGALADIQEQYTGSEEALDKAYSNMQTSYGEKRNLLGPSAFQFAEKEYKKLNEEEFIDLWIQGHDGLEGSYRIHPKDLDQAWKDALEKGEDFPLEYYDDLGKIGGTPYTPGDGTPTTIQPDPDSPYLGRSGWVIDVGGYGKETHESMAALPVQYLNSIYENTEPEWTKASNTLESSWSEGQSAYTKEQTALQTEGAKLGSLMADYQTDVTEGLEGTIVEDAYKDRRKDRQTGFSVLHAGR